MSINWVMLSPDGHTFVQLPNELVLYTSPPRTCLEISTPSTIPGIPPFSIKSDKGIVYISNQRLVYLPTHPTSMFKSFSCPILNLQDTFIQAPFFGANYWSGRCKPVSGGGIPIPHPTIELKLTFREGGAFDFHSVFEQIKERLSQAYSVAQETGQLGTDVSIVDLEPLPAYQSARELREDNEAGLGLSDHILETGGTDTICHPTDDDYVVPVPLEAPPDYEELQAQAVNEDLEQRLRREAESSAVGVA